MAAKEELAIIVQMKDFASRQFATLKGAVGGVTRTIFSLKGALIGLGAGFGATQIIDFAGKIEDTDRAFKNLTKSMGDDGLKVLNRLRTAFKDTVSDVDLMATANRAMMLGAAKSGDELELMATLARRLGKAMGRDAKDAFEDLALGIGRQSRMILDNLGIIVKVEDATEAYAKKLGRTADALTDAEKRQAFMNAVIEGAERRIESLGGDVDSLSDSWARLKTILANLGADVLRDLIPIMKEFLESSGAFIKEHRPQIVRGIADVVDAIGSLGVVTANASVRLADMLQLVTNIGRVDNAMGLSISSWMHRNLGSPSEPFDEAKKRGEQYAKDAAKLWDEIFADSGDRAEAIRKTALAMEDLFKRTANALRATADGGIVVQDLGAAFDMADAAVFDLSMTLGQKLPPAVAKATEDMSALEAAVEKARLEIEQWERLHNFGAGFVAEAKRMGEEAQQLGAVAARAMRGVEDAIVSNITNPLLDLAMGTISAKEAFHQMTLGILRDLAQIAMQETLRSIVKTGFGALGASFGHGGVVPGHLQPVRGHAAHGEIVRSRGLYELAELGDPEVVIPIRGGKVRTEVVGGRRGGGVAAPQVVVNYAPTFIDPAHESAHLMRNRDTIRQIVVQAMNESTRFRGAMQ